NLKAHFDGHGIVLDEPFELSTGTPLIVTVLSGMSDAERAAWAQVAAAGLARAYSDTEPEYTKAVPKQGRLFAFMVGTAYLLFVAQLFCEVTNWPFSATLVMTILGAAVVMIALSVLGFKAYNYRGSRVRFTFSTVFVASIPLCVHLAAIRLLLR